MKQLAAQKFESNCKLAFAVVDNDMGLGAFHDFLTELKGMVWERLEQIEKAEKEALAKKKEHDIKLVEPKQAEVEIV